MVLGAHGIDIYVPGSPHLVGLEIHSSYFVWSAGLLGYCIFFSDFSVFFSGRFG